MRFSPLREQIVSFWEAPIGMGSKFFFVRISCSGSVLVQSKICFLTVLSICIETFYM